MKIIENVNSGIKTFEITLDDEDYATTELVDARLAICSTCEYIVNNESCSKCSCLLQHRTKYKDIFCPEGKW